MPTTTNKPKEDFVIHKIGSGGTYNISGSADAIRKQLGLLGQQRGEGVSGFTTDPAIPQGTNPIPSYVGGKNYSDGIMGIQRDPNELETGGGIPDTTPYFTNRYGRDQQGLLASMGIKPEVLAQAQAEQTMLNKPVDAQTKQNEGWVAGLKMVAQGGMTMKAFNDLYKNTFGQDALDRVQGVTKKYEPKTQTEALEFEKKKQEQELGLVGEKERQKKLGASKAKFEADYPKVSGTISALNKQWDLVDETIDKALKAISPFTAGVGSWAKIIPATPQKTLSGYLETIRANIGFDKLQQMRTDSPTGGALGQVSDFENRLLQAVKGSLDQGLTPSILKQNIGRIKEDLANIRKDRNNAFKKDYSAFGASVSTPREPTVQTTPDVGMISKGYRFKGGDPSQESSWERVQ